MKNHNDILSNLNACGEAREFSKNYPDAEAIIMYFGIIACTVTIE